MRVPTWFRITAALWAAVFLFIVLTLPPATRRAQGLDAGRVVQGAFHVHTIESDGGGTREDVARAAAAAGLQFVILTDHGDGTRAPHPPEYLHGVLVMDGVEVTTSAGHYAAAGAAQSPYPLGGPPYAVAEDIARLGGFGVAAHPDSAKADLRWRDWNVPIDGLEWVNGDSAWRDERPMTLARGLIDYLFRPGPALAGLVERPARLLQRVDDMNRTRRAVALAGADAHARLPLTSDEEPYGSAWTVPAPSYAQSFRAFVNLVETEGPVSGDAERDAAAVLGAIRAGRVAFAMTALARPAHLQFEAAVGTGGARATHRMGARVPGRGPVTFTVHTSDARRSGRSLVRLALLRDGRPVAEAEGPTLSHQAADAAGVWRIEATLAHRPDVPWMLSNPIVILRGDTQGDPAPAAPPPPGAVLDLMAGQWTVERHAGSEGAVGADNSGARFTYRLAPGDRAGQFAAAVTPSGSRDSWDEVVIRARADRPSRVWVQLRLTDSGSGQRWGRSVYLDTQVQTLRIALRDFAALEPRASVSRPNVAQVRAVLIVADTVNTAPGASGAVVIEALRLERRAPLPRPVDGSALVPR